MKKIISQGHTFTVADLEAIHDNLPKGNYVIDVNPQDDSLFLTKINDLRVPETNFVDDSIISRILTSFNNTNGNIGWLLSGLKGTGKTVLAKKLCIRSGMSIINVDKAVSLAALAEFLSNPMFSSCVVFIDEFEKTIDQDDEEIAPLLKLMDGNYGTHLLFILTANGDDINKYLMNRLGRIKYRSHFTSLSAETISAIIDEYLHDPNFKEDLMTTCLKIQEVTIDILVNIIEEINLFNIPASELVKSLNIVNSDVFYNVHEEINGVLYECGIHQLNLSKLYDESISRPFLGALKQELLKKYGGDEDDNSANSRNLFTKEEKRIYNLHFYHNFSSSLEISKKDGIVTIVDKALNATFKLKPSQHSNLIF